jgi:hypothetical protein
MKRQFVVTIFPEDGDAYEECIACKNARDLVYILESKDGYGLDLGKLNGFNVKKLGFV